MMPFGSSMSRRTRRCFGGGWAMDSEFGETRDNLDAFSLGPVPMIGAER
jgi:hypothetical protein